MSWDRASVILLALVLAGTVAAAAAFPYIAPFVLAAVMALLVDPWVERIHRRWGWGRGPSVLFIVALATSVGLLGGTVVAGKLAHEVSQLLIQLPDVSRRVQDWTAGVLVHLDDYLHQLPHPLEEAVRRLILSAADLLLAQSRGLLALVRILPEGIFLLLVSALAAYFLVRDKHLLARALLALLPPQGQRAARRIFRRLVGATVGFLRVQLVLMTLTGLVAIGVFSLAGVPYPWMLGVLAGLLDLVPLIGSGAVFGPLIIGYLVIGPSEKAFILLAVWGAVILLRQLVEPYLVSSQMDLHPLTTLIFIYLGVQIIGVAGLLVGPLAAVFLKAAVASLGPRCHSGG